MDDPPFPSVVYPGPSGHIFLNCPVPGKGQISQFGPQPRPPSQQHSDLVTAFWLLDVIWQRLCRTSVKQNPCRLSEEKKMKKTCDSLFKYSIFLYPIFFSRKVFSAVEFIHKDTILTLSCCVTLNNLYLSMSFSDSFTSISLQVIIILFGIQTIHFFTHTGVL